MALVKNQTDGHARVGPLIFEWGESLKHLGRYARLQIGESRRRNLVLMVSNTPRWWKPPHQTMASISGYALRRGGRVEWNYFGKIL
jgi:hypothetical protein